MEVLIFICCVYPNDSGCSCKIEIEKKEKKITRETQKFTWFGHKPTSTNAIKENVSLSNWEITKIV